MEGIADDLILCYLFKKVTVRKEAEMDLKSPLSGDVTQFFKINPFFKGMTEATQQMGFINVYNVESGDPETELKVVEEVAGYGRQLGWILEALSLLIEKLRTSKAIDFNTLNPNELATITQITRLLKQVDEVKKKRVRPQETQ